MYQSEYAEILPYDIPILATPLPYFLRSLISSPTPIFACMQLKITGNFVNISTFYTFGRIDAILSAI